eukprot:g8112.t1
MSSMPSSPVVDKTRKAPSPSPSPFRLEAEGTPPSCSILGSKRARLDGDLRREKTASDVFRPDGINFGSDRGGCMVKHGEVGGAPRSADVDSSRWSKGGSSSQWNGSGGHSAADGNQELGGRSATGRGGGMSAMHPSGMEVVVGGDRHEGGPISKYFMKGGGEGGFGVGVDAGSGTCSDQPGGGAVISSGFGAGGFPKNQWHQDQGGSNDDMLILYGSPS